MSLLSILFLAWAIFFAFYTFYWFQIKYKFLDKIPKDEKKKYAAFVRTDKPNWNFIEFYVIGVLTLPIKLCLIIIFHALCAIVILLLAKIFDILKIKEKHKQLLNTLISRNVQWWSLLIFHTYGFLRIKKIKVDIDLSKYPLIK